MNSLVLVLFAILGLVPSLIWLIYYLKKDPHPEPRHLLLEVFFAGAFSAIPAALCETGLQEYYLPHFGIPVGTLWGTIIFYILGVGLCEEYFKYQAFKMPVAEHEEFNEPVDAMIYMTTAALGFAALENIGSLFNLFGKYPTDLHLVGAGLGLMLGRFLTATLLHVLCSSLFGYFYAKNIIQKHSHHFPIWALLLVATIHGTYNLILIYFASAPLWGAVITLSYVALLAIIVTPLFKRILTEKFI